MTPKKYPDRETIRQMLVLKGLLAEAHWRKIVNLLACAALALVIAIMVFVFWPQISAVWSQFLQWRSQVQFTVNP